MNAFDLVSKKVNLKKVSSTKGGEWQGPCPVCGGNDRFHVWPNQNDGKGGYWCRGCGKTGDNIQFLIDFEGMNFKEACAYLNITMADRPADFTPPPPRKQEFQPTQHENPADLWQEKAGKFITWAQANLKENKFALAWLAARGITAEAAEQARLGWNPGEKGKDIFRARSAWGLPEQIKENGKARMLWIPQGLVIPYLVNGIIQRIRIRREEGDPRYYVVPGSSMPVMVIGQDRRAFVIVESELDAIACAAASPLAGSVAMGSVAAKPDTETFAILKDALQILNALDYDRAGAAAFKWWEEQFDKCDRWPVPQGKDPGEAVALGIDLEKWIEAGLPPVLLIKKTEAKPGECRGEKNNVIPTQFGIQSPPSDTSPLLAELWQLLRSNPGVKIINEPDRFTILRNGKYGGAGRINELVFGGVKNSSSTEAKELTDYIMSHPDKEIGWKNLIKEK